MLVEVRVYPGEKKRAAGICCKRCQSGHVVKYGRIREKQRWQCKACKMNFVLGDERKGPPSASLEKKSLAMLLVCLGLSFRAAGLVVGVVRNTVMEWFRDWAGKIELPRVEAPLDIVGLDEMHHFIQKKKPVLDLESNNDYWWYS
jgi:transposase-like protein